MARRSLFILLGLSLIAAMEGPLAPLARIASNDPELARLNGVLSLGGVPLTALVEERDGSGKLVSLTPYVDGRRHGTVHRWFPDGQLHSSRRYAEGNKDGLQLGYWPNGTLRFRYLAAEGLYDGTYESWHANGQLGERRYFEDGRETGPQQTWDPGGQILSNYVVKDGRRYGLLDAKPCFTVTEGDVER